MKNKLYSKAEVEAAADSIRAQLKQIHPDLSVSAEKRLIKPFDGKPYRGWILLFKCLDIKFSMDPPTNIDAVWKAYLDASTHNQPKN